MKTKSLFYTLSLIMVIGIFSCTKKNSYLSPVTTAATTNTTASTTTTQTTTTQSTTTDPTTSTTTTTSTTSTTPATSGTVVVLMQNFQFVPAQITISAGTTVKWTNMDADSHDVSSNTGLFKSATMGQGDTFSYTFTTAGSYGYRCIFHAVMTGVVNVQ